MVGGESYKSFEDLKNLFLNSSKIEDICKKIRLNISTRSIDSKETKIDLRDYFENFKSNEIIHALRPLNFLHCLNYSLEYDKSGKIEYIHLNVKEEHLKTYDDILCKLCVVRIIEKYDELYINGGYVNDSGGHAIGIYYKRLPKLETETETKTKIKDKYKIVISNSGEGLNYQKNAEIVVLENVTYNNLIHIFKDTIKSQIKKYNFDIKKYYEEVLLPIINDVNIRKAYYNYKAQLSGSCTFYSVYNFINYYFDHEVEDKDKDLFNKFDDGLLNMNLFLYLNIAKNITLKSNYISYYNVINHKYYKKIKQFNKEKISSILKLYNNTIDLASDIEYNYYKLIETIDETIKKSYIKDIRYIYNTPSNKKSDNNKKLVANNKFACKYHIENILSEIKLKDLNNIFDLYQFTRNEAIKSLCNDNIIATYILFLYFKKILLENFDPNGGLGPLKHYFDFFVFIVEMIQINGKYFDIYKKWSNQIIIEFRFISLLILNYMIKLYVTYTDTILPEINSVLPKVNFVLPAIKPISQKQILKKNLKQNQLNKLIYEIENISDYDKIRDLEEYSEYFIYSHFDGSLFDKWNKLHDALSFNGIYRNLELSESTKLSIKIREKNQKTFQFFLSQPLTYIHYIVVYTFLNFYPISSQTKEENSIFYNILENKINFNYIDEDGVNYPKILDDIYDINHPKLKYINLYNKFKNNLLFFELINNTYILNNIIDKKYFIDTFDLYIYRIYGKNLFDDNNH